MDNKFRVESSELRERNHKFGCRAGAVGILIWLVPFLCISAMSEDARPPLHISEVIRHENTTSPWVTWVLLADKKLMVTGLDGIIVWEVPCGIGRGNASSNPEKKSDIDRNTPVGD